MRPDPVDARPPTLEEKVEFTYNLYRVTPREVRNYADMYVYPMIHDDRYTTVEPSIRKINV